MIMLVCVSIFDSKHMLVWNMETIDDKNDMLMWQSSRAKPVLLSSIYVEQDANRKSFSFFSCCWHSSESKWLLPRSRRQEKMMSKKFAALCRKIGTYDSYT